MIKRTTLLLTLCGVALCAHASSNSNPYIDKRTESNPLARSHKIIRGMSCDCSGHTCRCQTGPAQNYLGLSIGILGGYNFKKLDSDSLNYTDKVFGDKSVGTRRNGNGMLYGLTIDYNFNPYFGFTISGMYLDGGKFNRTLIQPVQPSIIDATSVTKLSMYVINLSAKLMYPIGHTNLVPYVSAGAAVVADKFDTKFKLTDSGAGVPKLMGLTKETTNLAIRPQLGGGIIYAFSSSWSTGLNYEHIFGKGKSSPNFKNYIPSVNLTFITLAYHW